MCFLTSYYVSVKKSSLRLKNLLRGGLIEEGMIRSWIEWRKKSGEIRLYACNVLHLVQTSELDCS
jgi:hypothetical protein